MRARLRDLGFSIGHFPVGPANAITDVGGVRVGHSTLIIGDGPLEVGKGPVRTGVTAVIPRSNIFENRVLAGGFVLNGAGEVSGLTQVQEWGLLETPILLTNTMAVGKVSDAAVKWMTRKWPKIGGEDDVVIPLVGECDDSWLNDAVGRHVRSEHVYRAIEQATTGKVAEGSVGAGTGLVTCDFKAGIGTSSRRVTIEGAEYAVGILVQSNFGVMRSLRVDGAPVGEVLEPALRLPAPREERGLDHHHRRDRRAAAVVAAGAHLQARGAGHRPARLVRGAQLGRDHRQLLDRQRGAAANIQDDRHHRRAAGRGLRPALRSGGRVHRGGDRQFAVHGGGDARPVGTCRAGLAAGQADGHPAQVPQGVLRLAG